MKNINDVGERVQWELVTSQRQYKQQSKGRMGERGIGNDIEKDTTTYRE